jgi:hypothetical protein
MEHIEDLVGKRVGGCRTFWHGSQNWGSEKYPSKLAFFFGIAATISAVRVAQARLMCSQLRETITEKLIHNTLLYPIWQRRTRLMAQATSTALFNSLG